jgi:hypothetical protein
MTLEALAINQAVVNDFERALRKGQWRRFIGRMKRRDDTLLSYSDLLKQHRVKGQRDLGAQIVPVEQIVGSLGRCDDFDRTFFPRQSHTRDRWMSIARAAYQDVALPLVELYKVGDGYFVKDGHHRISVARTRGQIYIDAHVIEVVVAAQATDTFGWRDAKSSRRRFPTYQLRHVVTTLINLLA